MLRIYGKHKAEKVTRNFNSTEFDCKCNNPDCVFTFIDDAAVKALQKMRDIVGDLLIVNSGYRCFKKQASIRGQGIQTAKGTSRHEQGLAFDVKCDGFTGEELALAARESGFTGIGTAHSWIHCDLRDTPTEWIYEE